jgi:hypothetical protein
MSAHDATANSKGHVYPDTCDDGNCNANGDSASSRNTRGTSIFSATYSNTTS